VIFETAFVKCIVRKSTHLRPDGSISGISGLSPAFRVFSTRVNKEYPLAEAEIIEKRTEVGYPDMIMLTSINRHFTVKTCWEKE